MNPRLLHGVASPQSVHAVSATKHHMVGTPAYLPGGRVYHYAKHSGAGLVRGEFCVNASLAANHMNLATTTACMTVGSNVVTGVTLGATAAARNLYEDGILAVVDGGGEGQCYRIREHAAIASAGTGSFTLYDPIAVASDSSTEVSLLKDTFADIVVSVTDQADIPVGVPQVTVPAGSTDPQYFWVQTWGPAGVFVTGTPAVDTTMMVGTSTAGHLIALDETEGTATANVSNQVGEMMTVGINGEVQVVFLRVHGL